MALFNQPWTTPTQVRQRVGSTLISGASLFPNVGAAMIGAAIGGGAAGLFDPKRNQELGQAVDLQNLQQQWAKTLSGLDMTTPEGVAEGGRIMVNDLVKAGRSDLAMQLSRELPQAAAVSDDFLKEERKIASQSVKDINKRAGDIRASYGKLEELSKRAKSQPKGSTGRRQAINSMIANIVRLNSPGIVSPEELRIYTGGQGTTAALLDLLSGRGVNTDALRAQIDPSGGDPDGLLATGKSLILGEAPPIFDMYEDAKSRAGRAGMSGRAKGAIFGESRNIEALRKLATREPEADKQTVDPDLLQYMDPEDRALFE